jgi:hypothetical protein
VEYPGRIVQQVAGPDVLIDSIDTRYRLALDHVHGLFHVGMRMGNRPLVALDLTE